MTEIALRFEPPFARIILNRPERRNAISRAMWRALPAIRASIEAREDLLVALVEGEGAHFSAGAETPRRRATMAMRSRTASRR
jgi:enoyl-CoA hydratase/carnithine racemase